MMAGGDCDGDVYWITWHQQFLEGFNLHDPSEPKAKNINKD